MKPSDKLEDIEHFIDEMAITIFGTSRTESIKSDKCVACRSEVDPNGFKDEISKREYAISGMCQECQDSIFG